MTGLVHRLLGLVPEGQAGLDSLHGFSSSPPERTRIQAASGTAWLSTAAPARGRSVANVTSSAIPTIAVAASPAAWNPSASASGDVAAEAVSEPLRTADSAASTASPSASPTWPVVFSSPEASPVSVGRTRDIASIVSEGNVRPPPRPSINSGNRRLRR